MKRIRNKTIVIYLFRKIVSVLPFTFLVKKYSGFNGVFRRIVGEVLECRIYKNQKFLILFYKYIKKANKARKYCSIDLGIYEYKQFDFCFVRDMMALSLWSIFNGYLPIININEKGTNCNLWEKFCLQPLGDNIEGLIKIKCPIIDFPLKPRFECAYDNNKVEIWNTIFSKLYKYNSTVQNYIEIERKKLISNKSILAVVLRGPAYTEERPTGHPIQPNIEELFIKIDEVLAQYDIDRIYLATEDKIISQYFQKKYGELVLENKREYSGLFIDEGKHIYKNDADIFLRGVEYLSSVNILKSCDYLVAGLCGASEFAIYFNGLSYEYKYIFNKGLY